MRFSRVELWELLKAWAAVSLAFAILYTFPAFSFQRFLLFLGISAFIVGSGFLLHELAHKFLAQRYGCWAEFRSDTKMLLFMILVSFFGFIFAAPGGVLIHGRLTPATNGKISLAGPMTNLLLALLFFLLILAGIAHPLVSFGLRINSWLGFFNLLPFWQLDGLKVLQWHKGVYGLMIVAAIVFLFLSNLSLVF